MLLVLLRGLWGTVVRGYVRRMLLQLLLLLLLLLLLNMPLLFQLLFVVLIKIISNGHQLVHLATSASTGRGTITTACCLVASL